MLVTQLRNQYREAGRCDASAIFIATCLLKIEKMFMNYQKFFWAIRAILFKCRFKKFGWPGYIGRPTYLENTRHAQIGNRVRIFPGLRLEVHSDGEIVIEDNVAIGQNFHITSCAEALIIGSDTTISGNVFITNIDHEYREIGKHVMNQELKVSTTRVGKCCFIGYGAAIQAGTILGDNCIVGANSVVRGKFPDRCVVVGAPARIVKVFNEDTQQWMPTENGKK